MEPPPSKSKPGTLRAKCSRANGPRVRRRRNPAYREAPQFPAPPRIPVGFASLFCACTVSVYMVPRRDRPLQTWKTFLRHHMEGIASIDLFVVPTIAFQQLFAL